MEIMLGERTRHFARFLNFQDIVLYLPFCNPPDGKGGERVVNFSISLVHQANIREILWILAQLER